MCQTQMRVALVTVIVLTALIATANGQSAPANTVTFNFHEYLIGKWEVMRGSVDTADGAGEQTYEALNRGYYEYVSRVVVVVVVVVLCARRMH